MASNRSKTTYSWAVLSLMLNGMLLGAVVWLSAREQRLPIAPPVSASAPQPALASVPELSSDLGPRHLLSYQQWVALLQQEAIATAEKKPEHLAILAGDSISLWFPPDLLPPDRTWLNQGISGETSAGLLERLDLFDATEPEVIFVMIGINDLIRGEHPDVVISNLRRIVRYLHRTHPDTQIVVQSILPHGADRATWEGRAQLLALPNSRIQEINRELAAIAADFDIYYLDLYPLFADRQGNLNPAFTTDGLHLNSQGYLVWRSALQLYSQLELDAEAPHDSPI